MIRHLFRRTRRVAVPGALVLMYHRVATVRPDPWKLCVSPEHFDQQMQVLRGMQPLSLPELLECLRAGKIPRRTVAVTFDDGYADNLEHAFPILQQHGIPATVFVVSGQVTSGREFWWDELQRVLLDTPELPRQLSFEIDGREYKREVPCREASDTHWSAWEPQAPGSRRALYCELWSRIQALAESQRSALMNHLLRWAGLAPCVRGNYRVLSKQEVAKLYASGLVEIGAHTVSHVRLSSLTKEAAVAEVEQSKRELEQYVGRKLRSFSYPFGGRSDVGSHAVAAVRSAGFECACLNSTGVVESGASEFELPRFHVGNWTGEEFKRRVDKWLAYA